MLLQFSRYGGRSKDDISHLVLYMQGIYVLVTFLSIMQ